MFFESSTEKNEKHLVFPKEGIAFFFLNIIGFSLNEDIEYYNVDVITTWKFLMSKIILYQASCVFFVVFTFCLIFLVYI